MSGNGSWRNALIERESEVAALRELVDAAARGDGGLVTLIGTAGIGKTALIDAVRSDAVGLQVLSARGGELEREFPYGLMRQLFEPLLRASDETERLDLLSGAAGPARGLLGGDATAVPADSAALDHAFYWLVATLSEAAPLLLVVDDAHWADVASLRTLVHIARRLDGLPVGMIVATRPVADGPNRVVLERLLAEAQRTLEPDGLSDFGVRSLLDRRLTGADDPFSHSCREATGGNPFLVAELISALEAAGVEPVAANARRVRSIGPQTVMRSVLLRLESLPAEAAAVAHALAVLGDVARTDLVAKLAGIDDRTAATAVDALRGVDILAPDMPLRFIHSIVHAAVYEDQPAAERSRLHLEAAHLLAAQDASSDAVAAQLLATEPGADPWVLEQLVGAASTGLAQSAPETMAAYLERALAESVPGADRARLLFFFGGARYHTVEAGAVEPLEEALELASEPRLRMEIARALGSALVTEKRYDECWQRIPAWIEELAVDPQAARELEIFAAHQVLGDFGGTAELRSRIMDWTPDPAGLRPLDRTELVFQSWVAMNEARPAAEILEWVRTALAPGTMIIDDVWYPTFDLAMWELIACGAYDEALAALDDAIATVRGIGHLLRSGTLVLVRAELHRRCGRLRLAAEDARIAAEIVPPGQVYDGQAASVLALAMLELGDTTAAWEALRAYGFADELPAGGMNDVLWFARGRLRIADGRAEDGIADLRRFGEISDANARRNPGLWPWRSTLAEALVRVGERDRGHELASEELEHARRVGLTELEGAPLRALGLAGGDLELLAQSSAATAGSPLVLEHLRSQLELGTALRLRGKRERSRGPLLEALETATAIGAGPIAKRAHEELLASGARPRRTALRGPNALTPSEHRVASLAAQGMTNRQIAQALYITTKTVEAHLRNSYNKLEVSGKQELAQVFDAAGGDELAEAV